MDFEQGEQIVHKMKGSAGSIGAKKLHAASLELQMALRENNTAEISALSATFYDRLTKTLSALKEYRERSK